LAGFEVTLYGRFWVTPEACSCGERSLTVGAPGQAWLI